MATYREIKGLTVQSLSTDPSLGSGNEGQVWYNSTSGKLKGLVGISAWSSGANLVTKTSYEMSLGPTGTQSAMLLMGRYPTSTQVQHYNGSGWFNDATLNTARYGGSGFGTTTAACIAGNGDSGALNTEEFNGTTWSEVNNITALHQYGASAGTQTAA